MDQTRTVLLMLLGILLAEKQASTIGKAIMIAIIVAAGTDCVILPTAIGFQRRNNAGCMLLTIVMDEVTAVIAIPVKKELYA